MASTNITGNYMSVIEKTITEAEVRAMRDQVYGKQSADKYEKNWTGCREHWLTPENIQWLREHSQGRKSA